MDEGAEGIADLNIKLPDCQREIKRYQNSL
jgi:hypothetical protein